MMPELLKNSRRKKCNWHIFLFLLLLAAIGCNERELVSDLNQADATELLVVLSRLGISGERREQSVGKKRSYRIFVAESDYERSLEVLRAYGHPPENRVLIDDLTKQRGFVPNSADVANVRLSAALSAQIEELLAALPGVVDIRAAVRIEGGTTRASVVMRYLSDTEEVPFAVDQVKQLVTNAVPGLLPDSVLVETTRIKLPMSEFVGQPVERFSPLFMTFRIASSDRGRAIRELAVLMFLVILFSGVLGYVFGWWRIRSSTLGKIAVAPELRLESSNITDQGPRVLPDQTTAR